MRPLLSTYEVSLGSIRVSKYDRLLRLVDAEDLRPGGEAWCGHNPQWTWAEVDLGKYLKSGNIKRIKRRQRTFVPNLVPTVTYRYIFVYNFALLGKRSKL